MKAPSAVGTALLDLGLAVWKMATGAGQVLEHLQADKLAQRDSVA